MAARNPMGLVPLYARLAAPLGAGALALMAGCASQAPAPKAAVVAAPLAAASQPAADTVPAQPAEVVAAPPTAQAQVQAALAAQAQAAGVQLAPAAAGGLQLRASGDAAFGPGKALLTPRFKAFLQELARQMQAHAGLKASVVGHTDSQGSAKGNERLSAARARAVQNELQAQGVAAQRLSAEGRGAREPIAANDSAEGRAANRRVDIVLAGE